VLRRLAEAEARVDDDVRPAHAGPHGTLDGSLEVGQDLGHEVRIARLGPVVHEHDRHLALAGQARQAVVVGDAPRVVDEIRARIESCGSDGRLCRVDRNRRLGQRLSELGDDRRHATRFLVG